MKPNQPMQKRLIKVSGPILLLILLVMLVSACSQEEPVATPPVSPIPEQETDHGNLEQLLADFQPQVQTVYEEGNRLLIDYQPAYLESQETSLVNTIALMREGAAHANQVEQVQVNLYSMADPGARAVSLVIDAGVARQFASGEIELEAFLEAIQGQDLRTTDIALSQELGQQGYREIEIGQSGELVEVRFRQPEVENGADVLRSWLLVFELTAQAYPDAQQVKLISRSVAEVLVSLPAASIRAYQAGELDAAALLLEMEITP